MFDSQPVQMNDMIADVMGAKGIVGVPPEIAIDALRKTAIDFCTQSTIWEFRDEFQLQYNVGDYPISVPQGTRLASMRWVTVNGYTLTPNTTGYLPNRTGMRSLDPNTYFASGHGYSFTMDGRDTFWITPVPVDIQCCDRLAWCAAIKPAQDSCWLPNGLVEDWNDALTSGAAYRLFNIPKQDWSNAGLGMQNYREYRTWIARARLTKLQNYTQAPGVMTGSYF